MHLFLVNPDNPVVSLNTYRVRKPLGLLVSTKTCPARLRTPAQTWALWTQSRSLATTCSTEGPREDLPRSVGVAPTGQEKGNSP
jgi:hypothetical protein